MTPTGEPPWVYRCAVFDPGGPAPAEVDTSHTLGVEITVGDHQRVCGLGNIDPQHTGADPDTAAVEAALTWPLPPAGSLLATNRADLDAVAAMAVLEHRARHGDLAALDLERVGDIAAADGPRRQRWPGPQPVDAGELAAPTDRQVLAHLAADATVAVADRVAAARAWLAEDRLPGDAERRRAQIGAETVAAITDATVTLHAQRTVAVVVSAHRLAFSVGYRHAPVVVATGPHPPAGAAAAGDAAGRKVTIGQYEPGWADLDAVAADLNAWEAHARQTADVPRTWGGQPTIKGSPQGVGTRLSVDDIVAAVDRHLLQRVGD